MSYSDSGSFVRVKRWFKRHTHQDVVTNLPMTYKIYLDWDIGVVDNNALHIFGSPYQLFSSDIYGTGVADSRVLVTEEEMPFSQLTGGARDVFASVLHFKQPNI
jgi:hypothetical protein